ncbi:phosphodiester glycosidase family protein [Aureibaculum sp. 2210JD6-5]|uniref:phosphodiester glycosidase family protein n=1 Tax=Aureibaculum sp. 2210JD6-5 TaxID=3103957 RepID=UPI002AAEA016|nr:phosphodiester glycosidase family protein [Aureibaculum sp. 2210JD6-5]MDY7395005.1 phosphodiester glycosidase family protein [Aureibaculum sp. 2210JD6-5]
MKIQLSFCLLVFLILTSCSSNRNFKIEFKDGWISKQNLEKGIVWKQYQGYYPIFNSNQTINVIVVDLKKSKLEFDWVNSKDEFMPVYKLVEGSGALIAINGTYPDRDSKGLWGSFFKRKDSIYQTIEYPKNHPLYWKTEGCITINSQGEIDIRLGNKALYEHLDMPYIMSSSPVLIQEGIPIGKYFIEDEYSDNELKKLDYEDQNRHQGFRHPRTAIGITKDNLLVMVVVDGRSEQAKGMNAQEITTLLFDELKCYKGINLDGGGSSTMWIKDQPYNGVVNYPTDNGKFDHDGSRSVSMALIIKPKNI